MTIGEHAETFCGKPVRDFDAATTHWDLAYVPRFRLDYDEDGDLPGRIAAYAALAGTDATEAIVIGMWTHGEDSSSVVEALVAHKDGFPALRGLFLGDIVGEENEISWIEQCDLSPLWPAFPKLEHMRVRGATQLSLGRLVSPTLTTLIVESGGLPRSVVREALAAQTPKLAHLELWLGTDEYGGDSTVHDFADLFEGKLFPNLRVLALRDCNYVDDLAKAVAEAPILGRIDTLDLSLGNLTDEGGAALAASPHVATLPRLDLHHHFLGDAMMAKLKALGPEVDLSEHEQAEEYGGEVYRNIAVSE